MAKFDKPILNPFMMPLREAEEVIMKLGAQKKLVEQELQWFHTTNRDSLSKELQGTNKLMESLEVDLEAKNVEIMLRQGKLDDLSSSICTLFNPKNWFASDQRKFRRLWKHLQMAQRQTESAKAEQLKRIQDAQNEIESMTTIINRYDLFDLEARQQGKAELDRKLVSARSKCERLESQKNRVDQALAPAIKQIRDFENQKQQALRIQNRARDLDDELSRSHNSYQRAMIHKQCEKEFDTGSPRKIIGQKDREIKQLERDREKAKTRALQIAQRASRIIKKIVIDGNNLCYANDRFIGVSVLEAIVPILDSDYSVVIVFDASIRRMLKINDRGIKGHFSDHVQVHIVATNNKADETILDLAEADPTTYALSNDRFGEFNDKQAVRNNRLIRHEIVDGRVFVHDLGISTTYNVTDG